MFHHTLTDFLSKPSVLSFSRSIIVYAFDVPFRVQPLQLLNLSKTENDIKQLFLLLNSTKSAGISAHLRAHELFHTSASVSSQQRVLVFFVHREKLMDRKRFTQPRPLTGQLFWHGSQLQIR